VSYRRNHMNKIASLASLILSVLLFAGACASTTLGPTGTAVPDGPQTRLDEARSQWTEAGITSYDFTFSRGCFCPVEYVGPYQATVIDGVVTAATYEGVDLLEIEVLQTSSYSERVLTVDEVFAEIARAVQDADSLEVTYHPDLGYPTSASIDWELQMADEEVFYTLSDLQSK
jgi:hypothetical protein